MKKEKLSKEQKKEVRKGVLTGLVASVALAAVVLVVVYYINTVRGNTEPGVIKAEVDSLQDITLSDNTVSIPYVKTDIPSVVYTADSAGAIKFYEFNGTAYGEIAESGNISVKIPLSGQEIPVSVHFVERDGVITGYGVFTSAQSSDVLIYNYMLVKITNLPSGYEENGKCLLLASTDITSVYSNNPVWEEAYVLNRSNGAVTRFLSENNRMLDMNGAVRSDFCMITDNELKSKTGAVPFFTSRAYDASDSAPMDVYLKSGGSEALAAQDVLDTYAKPTDDGGFVYLKKTVDGFKTVKWLNSQETTVNEFYAQYGAQYIRSGDWLLNKEDGRIYSTYNDTVIETPEFKINPTQFLVSDDGTYVVMAGTVANAADYQLYVYNTKTGKCKTFSDSDYSVHYNLSFAGTNAVSYYTYTASGYRTVVIDILKIA